VDAASASRLRAHLVDFIARGERRLVIDMTAVTYISSRGLIALQECVRRLHDAKGDVVLCGLTEPVRLVFDLGGFLSFFTVEESCAAALERVRQLSALGSEPGRADSR
jgi:anti-anti-sigma factor